MTYNIDITNHQNNNIKIFNQELHNFLHLDLASDIHIRERALSPQIDAWIPDWVKDLKLIFDVTGLAEISNQEYY